MKQAYSAIYYFDNSLKLTRNQFDLNTRKLQNYSYVNSRILISVKKWLTRTLKD